MDAKRHVQDLDYVRFATFIRLQATDANYEASFRTQFDSERERSPEQVLIVQSIWRINTLNRQLVEMVLSRLEQARPDALVTRLFQEVASRGIQSFETLKTPSMCDLTEVSVEYGRRIHIKPPSNDPSNASPSVWTIRSDFLPIVRYFHVIAHFVECTMARFRSRATMAQDELLEDHYRDWQFCRQWLTTLTEAIAALPSSERMQATSTKPEPPESPPPRHNEAMHVET